MTPIKAALLDKFSLYKEIHLSNPFCLYLFKNSNRTNFSWQGQQYTFTVLIQVYNGYPFLYYDLLHRYVDCFSLPQIPHWSITLRTLHWLDQVRKKELRTLEFLVKQSHVKLWEIKLSEIWDSSISVKFRWDQ